MTEHDVASLSLQSEVSIGKQLRSAAGDLYNGFNFYVSHPAGLPTDGMLAAPDLVTELLCRDAMFRNAPDKFVKPPLHDLVPQLRPLYAYLWEWALVGAISPKTDSRAQVRVCVSARAASAVCDVEAGRDAMRARGCVCVCRSKCSHNSSRCATRTVC